MIKCRGMVGEFKKIMVGGVWKKFMRKRAIREWQHHFFLGSTVGQVLMLLLLSMFCFNMADKWTVFSSAVKYCLEGWPALHIAHQQGFGGENFREKLEWLLDVIVQVFKDNEHVYPDELQEYISECLYNEFDIIVDDGTSPKVVERLCHFNMMCQTGQYAKVIEELRIPPPSCPPVSHAADGIESDDEGQEPIDSNQHSSSFVVESAQDHSSVNTDGNTSGDQSTPMEEDDDKDGWEVVRRSKKKHDSRKSN